MEVLREVLTYVVAAIGGGGVVTLLNITYKYFLNRRKQQGDYLISDYERHGKRITELESMLKECQEGRVALAKRVGELEGELVGLRIIVERQERTGKVAHVGCGPDGLITDWNPAASIMFGWSREEALGKPIFMIVPPRLRGQHDTAFKAASQRTDAPELVGKVLESHGFTKFGEEVPVTITVSCWPFEGKRMFNADFRERR